MLSISSPRKRLSHFLGMLLVTGGAVSTTYGQTAETALTQWMEGNFQQAKNTAAAVIAADKTQCVGLPGTRRRTLYESNSAAAQTDLEKAIKLSPGNVLLQAELAECYKALSKSAAGKEAG